MLERKRVVLKGPRNVCAKAFFVIFGLKLKFQESVKKNPRELFAFGEYRQTFNGIDD